MVKDMATCLKVAAGDNLAENRLGHLKRKLRRQNQVGRGRKGSAIRSLAVLAAAALHSSDGFSDLGQRSQ